MPRRAGASPAAGPASCASGAAERRLRHRPDTAIGVLTFTPALPSGDQDLADRAFVDGFDFHRRLVGLDLGDDLAGLDLVADVHEPLGEVALLHGRRQRGHEDLRHQFADPGTSKDHASQAPTRRSEAPDRLADGENDRSHEHQAGEERDLRLVDVGRFDRGRRSAAARRTARRAPRATSVRRGVAFAGSRSAERARVAHRPRTPRSQPRRSAPRRPRWLRASTAPVISSHVGVESV